MKNGAHGMRGTYSGTGFTGGAGCGIHSDFKDGCFFKKPAQQSEGTKQVAPWAVYEKTHDHDSSCKQPPGPPERYTPENGKGVDGVGHIQGPKERTCNRTDKENNPDGIGPDKGDPVLPGNSPRVGTIAVQPEDKILENAQLAYPGAEKFMGDDPCHEVGQDG